MFRRFHHGHSAALGFLLALAITPHLLWIVSAALVGGVVIGRAWGFWAMAAGALRDKWHLSRRTKISTAPVPVYAKPRATRKVSGPFDNL